VQVRGVPKALPMSWAHAARAAARPQFAVRRGAAGGAEEPALLGSALGFSSQGAGWAMGWLRVSRVPAFPREVFVD